MQQNLNIICILLKKTYLLHMNVLLFLKGCVVSVALGERLFRKEVWYLLFLNIDLNV